MCDGRRFFLSIHGCKSNLIYIGSFVDFKSTSSKKILSDRNSFRVLQLWNPKRGCRTVKHSAILVLLILEALRFDFSNWENTCFIYSSWHSGPWILAFYQHSKQNEHEICQFGPSVIVGDQPKCKADSFCSLVLSLIWSSKKWILVPAKSAG